MTVSRSRSESVQGLITVDSCSSHASVPCTICQPTPAQPHTVTQGRRGRPSAPRGCTMSSSAAGGTKDSGFDLTDQAFISDEFRMYHFKVRLLPSMHCHPYVDHRVHVESRRAPLATPGWRLAPGSSQHQATPAHKSCHPCPQIKRCPQARPHDWTRCPFAHPGARMPATAQQHASCAGLGHCPVGRAEPQAERLDFMCRREGKEERPTEISVQRHSMPRVSEGKLGA
jgi:hypothetical protein